MRLFKNITVQDLSECQYCFGEGEYERMYLGWDNEPRYYMQPCDHNEEDAYTVKVNIKRIRPAVTPFELVGGQMDTILKGIRL